MRHLTRILDLSPDDARAILDHAVRLKNEWLQGRREPLLAGRLLVQVYEKPSLRTRMSFAAAIVQLGGGDEFLSGREAGIEGREAPQDVARVLSRYADFVVLRTFSQNLIDDFVRAAVCPVINGLSDDSHPCQALTDVMTIREVFGRLEGLKVAFVGDGNNVASSLAALCAMLGVRFAVATPQGYELKADVLERIRSRFPDAEITHTHDPIAAVRDADVVYTDVWASMGQESEAERRRQDFAAYQVNAELLAHAPPTCRVMHCLPAKRGQEITSDVLDGPQSIVFTQAENRMHLAKGLLVWLDEQR
ncbi:MAG: ornithine carbamoyltransferase [Planctomycetota bacterium]|nr:MAG: ornithine carbamoyltransferase [Planctomycetota bacterium]